MKVMTRAVLLALLIALFLTIPRNAAATGCTPGVNCTVSGATPPLINPAFGEPYGALSSALFEYTKTDLSVGGLLPMEITRVYRSEDRGPGSVWNTRTFAAGTSLSYDLYLYSSVEVSGGQNPYAKIDVVMPDGSELQCVCSVNNACNGNQFPSTPLVCGQSNGAVTQPAGIWTGALLSYNSTAAQFDVIRKDATTYAFGVDAPLQSITDRYGNSVQINRSMGVITSISSSSGRTLQFNGGSCGGYPCTISDGTGRYVQYTYATLGSALTLTDVSTYDGNGIQRSDMQCKWGGTCQGSGAGYGDICDIKLTLDGSKY